MNMFDFWKEVIINDETRLKSLATVYAGTGITKTGLRVERVADYEAAYVDPKAVYKTLPTPGTKAILDFSNVKGETVEVILGLSVGQDSEFARPWSNFKKVITIAIPEDTDKLKSVLRDVFAGIGEVNGAIVTLLDPKVCVLAVNMIVETEDGDVADKVKVDNVVTTPNQAPVGTGEWILENLRFPTHANTRVAAPNADDMPVANANYVQYAFEYAVPKRGFHGQGAVGQAVTSVTHHVFYVREDLATESVDALFGILGAVTVVNDKDGNGEADA